jgi:four helix bundle protein
MNYYLDHEKLEVYRFAIQFVVVADEVVENLPRGRAYLADQLRRAGSSIALNIAEGAGEYAPTEKARFYRMAKRSATECSSVLDILQHLQLIEEQLFARARELLVRIVAMLIRMVQNLGTGQRGQMPRDSQMCGTGVPEKKLMTAS